MAPEMQEEFLGFSGDINVYALVYASVWCHDILVKALEMQEEFQGFSGDINVYILIPNWCHEILVTAPEIQEGFFYKFMSVLQSSTGLAHARDI